MVFPSLQKEHNLAYAHILKVYCLPIVLNRFLHILSLTIFHFYIFFKSVLYFSNIH